MTTDRFNYHKIKPGNHGIFKSFLIALSIHGVLFFAGEKLFVKPVQYSVQIAHEGIDVDLVAGLPQSDTGEVNSTESTTVQQQEAVKSAPQEELVTLPQPDAEPVKPLQPDADTVKSIDSVAEQPFDTVKFAPMEEQTPPPQSTTDTAKPIIPTTKQQQEAAKTMPRPSQGTVRTKSKPGYFQNRPPNYPPLAKKMRQEGLVMLTVVIDRKGMPVKVEVEQSSGYQLLDKAALEAVRRWRFQPERIGNIPTESRVTIPVRFRLEE